MSFADALGFVVPKMTKKGFPGEKMNELSKCSRLARSFDVWNNLEPIMLYVRGFGHTVTF